MRFHLVVPVARIGASPTLRASCDRETGSRRQVARVDLDTAPLARVRADGAIVRLSDNEPVEVREVCRRCLAKEGVAV